MFSIKRNSSVLCVDIGGTSSKVAVVDSSGALHFLEAIPTKPDAETYCAALSQLIQTTIEIGRAHEHNVAGIGVAVAGFLNPEKDRMVYNSNLAWLENFPLRARLSKQFGLPVELETDSNSACMAEFHFGSGGTSHRFLCVTVGTGLGAGMAVDGEPLRFAYGCLGDIGHIIVQPGGPLCTCGGRGCAEILVSAPVLAHSFATQTGAASDVSLRQVIEAATGGNQVAIAILRDAGRALGIAVASMANILFPDKVVIAGGLSAAKDFVLTAANEAFRLSAGTLVRANISLEPARLGSSATLMGAAWPFWKAA